MELKHNKLSLFGLSAIFSVTTALAATDNATDNIMITSANDLELHSYKNGQLSPATNLPLLLPIDRTVIQKESLDLNKIKRLSKASKYSASKSRRVSTASTSSSTVNYWTNTIIAGNRTFSGIKTVDGVYDPAITGDGNIVTIRDGVNGELVNINYSNPSSPIATNITPNGMSGASYPMAISAYKDDDGQYRSGMWGPLIKPGVVKVNPSGNAWSNTSQLYDIFPDAGHTHDIDRYGETLAIMRRANGGSGWKHNVMSINTSTVFNGGSFSYKLLSNEYGQEFVNASSNSQYPKISGSGQFIAYQSDSYNIVPNDTNYKRDVFVVNTTTQKDASTRNVRISVASDGTQANGSSSSPDISDDGRLVVYSTTATNLVTEGAGGIILHDRLYNTNILISVNASGIPATSYGNPSISYDGRFIAFESADNNLTTDDVTGNNAYVYDATTGEVRLASYSFTDGSYNLTASKTVISANGDHLVFLSGEYVYRVESPFENSNGWAASILTDDTGDIYRILDTRDGSMPESRFNIPIKIINKDNDVKNIRIENYMYYWTGSQYAYTGWTPHNDVCSNFPTHCTNGVPQYAISNNESLPKYTDYNIPFPANWPLTEYISVYVVTDMGTGNSVQLQMNMCKQNGNASASLCSAIEQ